MHQQFRPQGQPQQPYSQYAPQQGQQQVPANGAYPQQASQQYPSPYQQPAPQQNYQQPYQQAPPAHPQPQQSQYYAGGVNPAQTASAVQHADKSYSKGARRGGAWRILFLASLLVLICALGSVGYILYTYWNGQNEYDELAQEYMQVDDPDGVLTLASFNIDWDGLRAINPDVVGWVYVPGTVVNYPIVWRENDDDYYLKRTFGDNSVGTFGAEYGTIMLSGVNSPEWTDRVNVIFGHHLNNGSMFALFANMEDSAVFNEHRTVYVLTPVGNFRMTSFALDKVPGTSTEIVVPNFPTKEEFQAYVQARLDESIVTPNPSAPLAKDVKQVFAFSTCSQPDHQNRLITFCSVNEFLPAGSSDAKGNSLISEDELEDVQGMVDERLL